MKRSSTCWAFHAVSAVRGNGSAYMVMDVLLDDPRHQRLLEWELTAPALRSPATQTELAAELGVSARTLRDWKEKPEFQAAWRTAFNETAGSLERTKRMLDQLYEDSVNPDSSPADRSRASKIHFDIAKQVAPPEPDVGPSRRAQDMSDAELLALVSEQALAELDARGCVVRLRDAGVMA